MSNIIKFKQDKAAKNGDKVKKTGEWVPFEGRERRVWRCPCGSSITQVVEGVGAECVFCQAVIIPDEPIR